MRRFLVLTAITVMVLLVQSTVLAQVRLFGVHPDLIAVVVLAVAMATGPATGATYGFFAGLASDLLLQLPIGAHALVYAVLGYAAGVARVYVTSSRPWLPMALVAAASLLAVWSYGVLVRVLGYSDFTWVFLLRTGVLAACYNVLLTPLVYPPVRSLLVRSYAERPEPL